MSAVGFQCRPNMHEALDSIPSVGKKDGRKEKKDRRQAESCGPSHQGFPQGCQAERGLKISQSWAP